ncbi:MAG TPA: hypothetical protein VFV17_05540 [Usitatibacteraceae bacterium]|nr:hypothetical protein [Usitatibacteraceae bacterium]
MTTNLNGSYTHFPSPMKSYLFSILAILAAAVPGTVLAWLAVSWLGLTGIAQALATAFLAMVLSTAIYALLVAVGRVMKVVK